MYSKSLRGAVAALLFVTGAGVASAREVTRAESNQALQYLESTKKNVLEATKGLSEAQWNFKPAPDRWSVAQVMEHIAASEDFTSVYLSAWRDPGVPLKKRAEQRNILGAHGVAYLLHAAMVAF